MDNFNTTTDEKMELYNSMNSVKEPIIYRGIGLPDIDVDFKFETPTTTLPETKVSKPKAPVAKTTETPKVETPKEKGITDWASSFRSNLNENVSKYLDEVAKTRASAPVAENDSESGYFSGTVDSKYNGYTGPADLQELKKRLGWAESNHNYGAVFARTQKDGRVGSGAWGRYQFVWHWSGDEIKKVTGVKSPVEFLQSPDAQEKYFDFYYANTLKPKLKKFKKRFPNSGLSDTQVMEMMHFQGPDTFINLFAKGDLDYTGGKHNPSIRKRLDANYTDAQLNSAPKMKIPKKELSLLSK